MYQALFNIPQERRKLRPNVEAVIKELKEKTRAGKLKIRGIFKTSIFAYSTAISINFGRVFRYILENSMDITLIPQVCSLRKVKMCVNTGVAQQKATET